MCILKNKIKSKVLEPIAIGWLRLIKRLIFGASPSRLSRKFCKREYKEFKKAFEELEEIIGGKHGR